MNRDPIGENGGENVYAFVRNETCDLIDPLGMQYWPAPPNINPSVNTPYPGTITSDLLILNSQIAKWKAIQWNFAVAMLSHFVGNSGTDLNVKAYHNQVKQDSGWRHAMWQHFEGQAELGGRIIGDSGLQNTTEGMDLFNAGRYRQMFDYTFGNEFFDPWTDGNELFYALHGSQYSYFGRMCSAGGKWSIDVKILLRDVITFPPGFLHSRNIFVAYAAANDLQTHGWYANSLLYALWDDHFDSDNEQ